MFPLGDYNTSETVNIPFNSFSSNDPSASVTITNLVAGDIEIHKDGSITQRASDNGVTVSIDFDGVPGNHMIHIDLSDNSDDGYYADGSRYEVRIEGTTIDAGTVNAWVGAFSIGTILRPTTAGRTLAVSAAGLADADVVKISSSSTAADNLEAGWDGTTGVNGDTFPARQDQISALSIGAAGLSVNASGVNVTTGNETNSYTDTASAGVIHIVEDAAGTTLFEYEFDLGEFSGTATNFLWTGYVQSNGDTVDVQYFDWVATGWKTLQSLSGSNGTTLIEHDFDVPINGTGTGPNFGITKLRFSSTTTTAIGTDRVRCIFSQASAGIKNGSTITLSETQTNKNFSGNNWTLVLANQDISGSFFRGAHVTGLSSASTEVTFEDCIFGAGSYPPGHYRRCGIGDNDGRFTGASAGEYIFDNCYSVVDGDGTPDFTFAGATGINNRGWKGGSNYTLDATCMLSHDVLAGGGQTFNTGGAAVEIRGTCRSLTVDLSSSAAGLVQFVGTTGPITITETGTSTAVVNLYGISSSLTNTSSITPNDETTSRINYIGGDYSLDTASGRVRIVDGTGAGEINTNNGAIVLVETTTTVTADVTTDGTSRTASKADVSALATSAEVATVGLITNLVRLDTIAILLDTGELQGNQGDWATADVPAALEAIFLHQLFAADYDPASKPGVATALLNELVQDDGSGVSQFTVVALETGPSGSGSSASVIAAAVWDKLRASHKIVGSFGESNQTVSSADVSVSFSFGVSGYCSRSDINDIFGTTNVTKWADLDNEGDAAEITARVARAIVFGTTEINDRLRGGRYEIPLPITAAATIVDLCATLAGVWLYRSRGVDDESEIDKYKWHWDRVEKTLSEIRGGKRRLDTPSSTDTGGQAPFAV